jgi:hypothetical protein
MYLFSGMKLGVREGKKEKWEKGKWMFFIPFHFSPSPFSPSYARLPAFG